VFLQLFETLALRDVIRVLLKVAEPRIHNGRLVKTGW
jgi:hypothetical protein